MHAINTLSEARIKRPQSFIETLPKEKKVSTEKLYQTPFALFTPANKLGHQGRKNRAGRSERSQKMGGRGRLVKERWGYTPLSIREGAKMGILNESPGRARKRNSGRQLNGLPQSPGRDLVLQGERKKSVEVEGEKKNDDSHVNWSQALKPCRKPPPS